MSFLLLITHVPLQRRSAQTPASALESKASRPRCQGNLGLEDKGAKRKDFLQPCMFGWGVHTLACLPQNIPSKPRRSLSNPSFIRRPETTRPPNPNASQNPHTPPPSPQTLPTSRWPQTPKPPGSRAWRRPPAAWRHRLPKRQPGGPGASVGTPRASGSEGFFAQGFFPGFGHVGLGFRV